ncbi:MAG: trypsin-like peptidase domain-containing protein [Planctomycetes bacterium]|nr:trypsin-like peptidase domain-containing protein [Planctomycetota bacterium]
MSHRPRLHFPRVALSLAALLAAGVCPARAEERPDAARESRTLERAIITAVEKVRPSVIKLIIERRPPDAEAKKPEETKETPLERLRRMLGGPMELKRERGDGAVTAVILSADGYLLTSDYNIGDDAAAVRAVMPDGEVKKAQVLGREKNRNLALLKVEAAGLRPIAFADSASARVGQFAFVIGKTLGDEGSLSFGIISAVHRKYGAIQTDADINPGNEGGPLINLKGEVVGIAMLYPDLVAQTGMDSGIGFAIPSNLIQEVLPELKAGKVIEKPFLGVNIDPNFTGDGVKVLDVVAGGSAQKGGVKKGDVITSVAGRSVKNLQDLGAVLLDKRIGDQVTVDVLRDGETWELDVVLGKRPENMR